MDRCIASAVDIGVGKVAIGVFRKVAPTARRNVLIQRLAIMRQLFLSHRLGEQFN